jgi:hypothetical protein
MQTDVISRRSDWATAHGAPTRRPTRSSPIAHTVEVRPDLEPVST